MSCPFSLFFFLSFFSSFLFIIPVYARKRKTEKERDRRRALLNCQPPLPRFLFNFIEPAYAIVIMGGLVRYGTSVQLRADGFLNFCNALCFPSRATLPFSPSPSRRSFPLGKPYGPAGPSGARAFLPQTTPPFSLPASKQAQFFSHFALVRPVRGVFARRSGLSLRWALIEILTID